MIIKQIDAQDTYAVRNDVLRPNLPMDTCKFNGDKDENTFHLGAYVDDKLVSIASFYMHNSPELVDPFQYQLRGMATLREYRGQGLSKGLLKTAFPMIKNNHIKRVWCNARAGALGFYEKLGFEKISDEFEIEGVGTHVLMTKIIE